MSGRMPHWSPAPGTHLSQVFRKRRELKGPMIHRRSQEQPSNFVTNLEHIEFPSNGHDFGRNEDCPLNNDTSNLKNSASYTGYPKVELTDSSKPLSTKIPVIKMTASSEEMSQTNKQCVQDVERSISKKDCLEIPYLNNKSIDSNRREQRSKSFNGNATPPINPKCEHRSSVSVLQSAQRVPERSKRSIKHLRDTTTFQNLKTAGMLFVVAIVYIVTFLPAMLMVTGLVPLYLPIFYLYYVNNAINPLVYGFMNPNFRNDIKKLFTRR